MKNTHGYVFQDEFEDAWKALGKLGWLHRFVDASDLYGRNKKLVATGTSPADFLVAYDGLLALVECKATTNPLGFPTSMIARPQVIAATRCIAANVDYYFAVKQETSKDWFWAPASFVINQKGTIKWNDLAPYHWPEPHNAPVFAHHGGHRDHRFVA